MPPFLEPQPTTLVRYEDAAHATNLIQSKSVTGLVFMLAGGAIAYKSMLQTTTATYLCSVLDELGFPQSEPTMLHEDYQAVINVVNYSQLMCLYRHLPSKSGRYRRKSSWILFPPKQMLLPSFTKGLSNTLACPCTVVLHPLLSLVTLFYAI